MLYGEKGSVCEKVAERLKKDIEVGAIAEGEKLPSCRELASELGINPNTVQKAFSILDKEGVIEILPQKGAYAKRSPVSSAPEGEGGLKKVERDLASAKAGGASKEDIMKIVERVYGDEDD